MCLISSIEIDVKNDSTILSAAVSLQDKMCFYVVCAVIYAIRGKLKYYTYILSYLR